MELEPASTREHEDIGRLAGGTTIAVCTLRAEAFRGAVMGRRVVARLSCSRELVKRMGSSERRRSELQRCDQASEPRTCARNLVSI
jgi:hypothetical protein